MQRIKQSNSNNKTIKRMNYNFENEFLASFAMQEEETSTEWGF